MVINFIRGLALATINLISDSTNYKDTKGDTKY